MKEWKLVRNSDLYVSMIYYQDAQPDFNPAFGNANQFHFESRDLSVEEWDTIQLNDRREKIAPKLAEFLEAIYMKEVHQDTAPMQSLMAAVNDIIIAQLISNDPPPIIVDPPVIVDV